MSKIIKQSGDQKKAITVEIIEQADKVWKYYPPLPELPKLPNPDKVTVKEMKQAKAERDVIIKDIEEKKAKAYFRYSIEKKTGESGSRIFMLVEALNKIADKNNNLNLIFNLYGEKNSRESLANRSYNLSLDGTRGGKTQVDNKFYISKEGVYKIDIYVSRQKHKKSAVGAINFSTSEHIVFIADEIIIPKVKIPNKGTINKIYIEK